MIPSTRVNHVVDDSGGSGRSVQPGSSCCLFFYSKLGSYFNGCSLVVLVPLLVKLKSINLIPKISQLC